MKSVDFKRFMFEQGIKQSDLAKYLGVSEGYISQVASGKKQLSEENYGKVLNNPFGWDVSMLENSDQPENPVVEKPEDAGTIERLFALIDDQRAEIKMLLNMLKEKDEKIEELRKELDARKGKTASDADGSSAAIAV